MSFYDYRIGAGWNVALGSLTNIETITPTGEPTFKAPDVYGSYDPGVRRIRADGSLYHAGFGMVQWRFAGITRGQVRYLMETYCANGYSGKVTINTRLDDPDTYTRYNAYMLLPKLSESQKRSWAFQDYIVRFTRLAASS